MEKKASENDLMLFLCGIEITEKRGLNFYMSVKKKFLWISAIIIVAAIVIVICVSVLTNGQISEFDGTLVRMNFDFPKLI